MSVLAGERTHRVLLVEDDPAVRDVIAILIGTEPDLALVGTAGTAEEGLELVTELSPDLVLLDNQLDGPLTGVQAAPAIKERAPSVVVLLCTALDLGAVADTEPSIDGFLRKDELVTLVDVVRQLLGSA
nr:protein-glutamate methylesterase/protein-glutamine glutaminase [uncultured bacterium]